MVWEHLQQEEASSTVYKRINNHPLFKKACQPKTTDALRSPSLLCCSLIHVIGGYFKQLQSHWLTFSWG